MARSKFKLTGFSRFLLFMLFFAPVAYIGISYYQGEDGLQNVKNIIENFGEKESTTPSTVKEVIADPQTTKTISIEDQIQILRTRIEQLEKENAELKRAIEQRN